MTTPHRMMTVSRVRQQCVVCHCMEGSLTTECPGSILTESIREEVAENRVDFIGGQWVRKTVKDD